MKRAISYKRYSRGHQRNGRSEDRQATGAADYCKRHGWALDDSLYADRGVSGWKGANAATGALGDFLNAIKSGKVKPGDVLIVESLDRLSRQDIDEAYDLFRGILRTGVEIVTLEPERHYDKSALKSITGIIEPLVIMARANEESSIKSARGKDVWRARRAAAADNKKPVNNACPRWLICTKTGFKVIPERVEVIKRIFALCLEGRGCIAIARTLNKEGADAQGARQWEEAAIGRILRNRAVLGDFQPKTRGTGDKRIAVGSVIPGYYPEVIDPATFWRAQGIVNARKNLNIRGREGVGVANLFTGLLWDAKTGSALTYKHTTAGKYLDSADARGGKARACGFKYEVFEAATLAFLKDQIDLFPASKPQATTNRKATEAELAACEARLKRTQATMATTDDQEVYASLAEVLAQITHQRKALQNALDKANTAEQADPEAELRDTQEAITIYLEGSTEIQYVGAAHNIAPRLREMRPQLKSKIRSLVSQIWVSVEAKGWRSKTATVEIHFHGQQSAAAFTVSLGPDGSRTITPIQPPFLKLFKHRV